MSTTVHRNRLKGIVTTDVDGNVIESIDYDYDVFNRRIEKTVDSDGDGVLEAETERYVYDGEHIALVFDGDGELAYRYLHGPGTDQVLAQEDANGDVLWALADHQLTVRDLLDNEGNVVNHISYDSFGNTTSQSNPDVDFRFGYTGREFDGETGDYYYRARYFDSSIGQFISQDPLDFAAGDMNLYGYVGNSPINYIDPNGLTRVELRYRGAFPGHQHADIVITRDDGSIKSYWARAEDVSLGAYLSYLLANDAFGDIAADQSREGEYGEDYIFYVGDEDRIQLIYDSEETCHPIENIEELIEQAFDDIAQEEIPYDPFGANSNYAAFEVLDRVGFEDVQPIEGVNPTGWDALPEESAPPLIEIPPLPTPSVNGI